MNKAGSELGECCIALIGPEVAQNATHLLEWCWDRDQLEPAICCHYRPPAGQWK